MGVGKFPVTVLKLMRWSCPYRESKCFFGAGEASPSSPTASAGREHGLLQPPEGEKHGRAFDRVQAGSVLTKSLF